MEITENKNNQKAEKTFNESQLVLKNRINLTLSGLEKVYETNENKIQLKVSNSNLLITGENLNISRLDVESGNVSVEGKINELKYLSNEGKGNIFKKLFK